MNRAERELFWEMVRTIKLLGGKEDILDVLKIINSPMSQSESIDETYKLVKCWNDAVENEIDSIPENEIYSVLKESSC